MNPSPEDKELQALADAERDWKVEKTKACQNARREWEYADAQRERELETEMASSTGKLMPTVIARKMKIERNENTALIEAWVKYQNSMTAKAEAECHYNALDRRYWAGRRAK